jgi:hypothetical protein
MAATPRVVDLTNVKEGGVFKPRRKPEGDYRAKIVKADDHQPKDKDKSPGWVLTIMVDGDARSTYPFYLNPAEKEVWKIGAICRAAGIKAKNARVKFNPNILVGKKIGIALADDEYEGRIKSTIDDVFPESEVGANADEDVPEEDEVDVEDDEEIEDEEVEEEPPAPKRRTTPPTKRVARARTAEPEDDEEEEEDEPEPPKPVRRRRKPAPEPEPEDDDEDDEEEEEPAPPPQRKRRTRPKPPPADEDDDLDEIETDEL